MPKLTITADEEVLRWARVRAAEEDTSVARFVGGVLKDHMQAEQAYQASRRRFLSVQARPLSQGPYPKRDELHDRTRLR